LGLFQIFDYALKRVMLIFHNITQYLHCLLLFIHRVLKLQLKLLGHIRHGLQFSIDIPVIVCQRFFLLLQ